MQIEHTQVAIVGGGPAGLMLAIELGCRGIDCMVLEEDASTPVFPKANATSSRTMEHYRRRGFSSEIRALGLPADHAQDVMYCTRLNGAEMARFRIPSSGQAAERSAFGDYGAATWPTPELPHRAQQMYIEPILKRQAERYPSVQVCFGARVTGLTVQDQGALLEVENVADGKRSQVQARYVVGCDGARSLVRKSLGIRHTGESEEEREFFGGQMLSVFFRSPDLYQVIDKPRAWQYWVVNPQQRGLLLSIDGIDTFLLCVQLKKGQVESDIDVAAVSRAVAGAPFGMEIIAQGPWLAGYTLVAERFSTGPVFLAGDAAHLFTPTGGMGYNTSIDDVVNLGWKLAAVLQGWAPASLLDSYEAERKPIAERNTAFARRMADSIGHVAVPTHLEMDNTAGAQARAAVGAELAQHVRNEFNIPGLQLGLRYTGSPIVAHETSQAHEAPPADDPNNYIPTGHPGGRAPHLEVGERSLLDLYGRDFTLAVFDDSAAGAWEAAAARLGLPLTVLHLDNGFARALYGAKLALIRPDHHIAWRGNGHSDPEAVLRMASGGSPSTAYEETNMQASTGNATTAPARRLGVVGVHSVHQFVYTVPDLDVAEKFYTTFGLDVRRTPKTLQLYTYGHPNCWAEIHQGGTLKHMEYVTYGIYAEDEVAFRERIAKAGLAAEPHPLSDGTGLWVRDPDGYALQLKVAPKVMASEKSVPSPEPVVARGAGAAPARSRHPKVHPRRLSHILRFTPDVLAMVKFHEEILGCRLSDCSGEGIAFVHGLHGSDHHLVAFAKSHAPGLHHSSWDVGSVNDVGFGSENMKDHGYTNGWGVGRHVLGSNYFYYVQDPWGSFCEYSYDIDFIPADLDWKAGDHPPEDSFYLWGPAVPDYFVANCEFPLPAQELSKAA
ncbi:MAG TPA: FAD-dependent monooxygenase [Burkholderiales bacterium]|jgi:2-polyprenyl-6-methoxyphenol hydroxylase-like FAD-dependent oxidoreductase|nr:FAD-dependent monooxygenase [Burkholderiales bacterium]